MKRAIILDFDGVLVDSIAECYIVSKDAFFGFTDFRFDESAYKKIFYQHRGLVGPPFEYMALHKTIILYLENSSIDFEREFVQIRSSLPGRDKKRYEYLFFEVRKFYQQDMGYWLSLNSLTEYGKTLQNGKPDSCYIITTKDEKSVELLLHHFGISVKKIFGHNDYQKHGSKGAIISNFLDNSDYDGAVFIDDAVEHLESVSDERVLCYFADWGYGKMKASEHQKIKRLSLSDSVLLTT